MAWLWSVLLGLVSCELLLVLEVCRHGARGPSEVYYWNKEYWRKEQLFELTEKGREQHRALGRTLRTLYPQLVEDGFDWRQIEIASTDTRRTIESSLEQLIGMFPGLEYDSSDLHQPYLYDHRLCYPLNFTVKVNGDNTLLQAYRIDNCPRMVHIHNRVMKQENYQEMEKVATDFQHLLQPTEKNMTTLERLSELAANVKCDLSEGISLPEDLNESLLHVLDLEAYYRYTVPFSDEECRALSCSDFFTALLAEMEAASCATKPRFIIYSAHEMTLGVFRACLSLSPQDVPDFASNIIIEYHSDQRVIIRYNLKIQRMENCPEPCRLPTFKEVLQPYIVEDMKKACEEGLQPRKMEVVQGK